MRHRGKQTTRGAATTALWSRRAKSLRQIAGAACHFVASKSFLLLNIQFATDSCESFCFTLHREWNTFVSFRFYPIEEKGIRLLNSAALEKNLIVFGQLWGPGLECSRYAAETGGMREWERGMIEQSRGVSTWAELYKYTDGGGRSE